MLEDQIAELDFDWSAFPESEPAAFAFTRKLTLEPHRLGYQDIHELKRHYTDNQVIELVQAVAGFNSTNRWTDALGLPQDTEFSGSPALLETATSENFQKRSSKVAVLTEPRRPPLESRDKVEQSLNDCRSRQPYVVLPDSGAVDAGLLIKAELLGVPNFARALSIFPVTAKRQLDLMQGIVNDGLLPAQIKAKIWWATSRENRAWYSLGQAQRWLHALGLGDDEIFAMDFVENSADVPDQAAIQFARKLTSHPRLIADQDISDLRNLFSDKEVAEIVFMTCFCNMFCEFTEALGLPLEE